MFDNQINGIISSGVETKGLNLLGNQRSIGSLSASDEFSSDEIHRFWMNSRNIQDSKVSGSEKFPGEFLKPSYDNVLLSKEMQDLMVEYYIATYENLNFRKPFDRESEDAVIISVKMNQFGRCRIGSEVFGSSMSSRHIKSSYILSKFITNDETVDCYPGQVQYFFTHTINLPDGLATHFLAYVRWYKHASSEKVRFYFSDDENTCNVELWNTEFYPESRDCIIPVHNILGRFIPVNYRISGRRTAKDYLAINPVNRKFNFS
jgi:hypothetical protein